MDLLKLYLVHCGFYDSNVSDGLFESHTNLFVVAESFELAKAKVKETKIFQTYRMHIDGLQEINAVQGFEISLTENPVLSGDSVILKNKHRELAHKIM